MTAALQRVPASLQWTALSERGIRAALREGDLILAFASPLTFFVCIYVPLRRSMEAGGIDYAQYLAPLIVVQAMFFTAMFAGDRAAREVQGGMGTRLRAMPVRAWVPPAARISANLVRAIAALAGALVVGSLFGFRFHGLGHTLAFVLLTLAFGTAVILAADALGTATANPELGATVLFAPQLLLLMMSTGFVPAEGFPGWIQPFVRNQPVSQVAGALRELAAGSATATTAVAVAWVAGLVVPAAVAAVRVERRRGR
ncbi:ABC transporter permease [Nocardia harenae]|uniref:ABC transporter permease n=1 Tax=Nocardia harenae TaxID=358707 RepID=UPI00082EF5E2|nr:ABC transporter permease [Nocardia harenae]